MSLRPRCDNFDWFSFRVGPQQPGSVALVGAGPGDAALITIRGASRVAGADVILYDRLVNPALLALAPPSCERLEVGKRPGHGSIEQGRINEALIEYARAGRRVLRLKGGDAFMFSRGGEEAEALAEAGIPFEVVSGVTSGIAAPVCAGIPLTKRGVASTIAFVTGHKDPTQPEPVIDYEALARMNTVGIYMGLTTLEPWCRKLIEVGKSPGTPVAVIRTGTRPDQRTVVGTLADIPEKVRDAGFKSPAIVLVGEVVPFRDNLNWFEGRPLFGQRVINTRPEDQAAPLSARLTEFGAEMLEAPTVRTVPPDDWSCVDAALRRLNEYDWLVLTSANGVDAMIDRLRALSLDGRALSGVRIAAIGPVTAARLEAHFITADLQPEVFVGEALAQAIVSTGSVSGQRILLLRSDIAREQLPHDLTAAGAQCDDVAVYRTVAPPDLPARVIERLERREVEWITFTSPSTIRNFLDLLGAERRSLLEGVRVASIGPITSKALEAVSLAPTVEAVTHTVEGLVDAIVKDPGSPRSELRP